MALPRTISFRATVKWPASFIGEDGIALDRSAAGEWTASLDIASLTIDNSVDINNDYMPYYDASVNAPRRATLTAVMTGGLTGLEYNTRLAKTANYTLVNADKGKTLALGGTAFFTLTIGAASGFDSDFIVRIVNEDSTRAKRISPNGVTSFLLWPKQTMHLYNQNNVWQVDRPAYWNSADAVLHVDPVNGLDTNDGLTTGSGNALLTIQKAVDIINDEWLGSGDISLADGIYSAGANITGSLHGDTTIAITGNTGTPSNVQINIGGSSIAFWVQDHAGLTLSGMRIASSGSGSQALATRQYAIADFSNIEFSVFTNGTHIAASDNSGISAVGPYAIIGDAAVHVAAQTNSFVHLEQTVTINSALAFTTFARALTGGIIDGATNFTGAGVAGTTGTRFTATDGARVSSGITYPGNAAGFSWAGDTAYGGTVASPYYNFSSLDEDTGAYRIGANNYGIAVGGSKIFDGDINGVEIKGTTTNDSATTGYYGEYGTAELAGGAATGLVTNTAKTVVQISLPAGDLDVWGQIIFTGAATTTLDFARASISATTNTEDSDSLSRGQIALPSLAVFNTGQIGIRAGPIRISLAAPTNYFLVAIAGFAVSTCSVFGKISYRRVR